MLSKQREEINKIDRQLVELLERRMEVVTEVAEIKKKHHLAIFDSQREQAILQKLSKQITDSEKVSYILDSFQAIMDDSKNYQTYLIQKEDHSSE